MIETEDVTVVSVNKPNLVVSTATAVLKVGREAPFGDVVRVGLAALGESPASLFGFGIYGHKPGDIIGPGTVTVYAYRD